MSTKLSLFFSLVTVVCFSQKRVAGPADIVNPMIGTHKMGHTFPGATTHSEWYN